MVYKEKDAQLEDNRSTAYTFLGVGIAGLILSFFLLWTSSNYQWLIICVLL